MSPAVAVLTLFSILFPARSWFTPDGPITINVKPSEEITLVLTDFSGKAVEAKADAILAAEKSVDLRVLFPTISTPNTYVLWAVPKGKMWPEFTGTPLVIGVRVDKRVGAPTGAIVVKVEPLVYAQVNTKDGDMTFAFFYDAAPNTIASFTSLAQGGFFDGLTFHRVVKDFIIQGGDPRADGTGGPGYSIHEEFNTKEHREGVLSMAREPDPLERQGAMPRCEAANSAGSQFFICLNYERTKQLDGRYTVFGRVIDGMDVVRKIGGVDVGENDKPVQTQVINSVKILPVESGKNPYATLITAVAPSTR